MQSLKGKLCNMRVQSVNYTDINILELKIDCLFLYLAIIYSHKNGSKNNEKNLRWC